MLIADMSTDDVNRVLAIRLGASGGVQFQTLVPDVPVPDGKYDAVLYDLESVSARGVASRIF
jgi:hypothetical protein